MSLTQQMAGLTWILCKPPVPARIIAQHQRILGVTFPDDFCKVIQRCSGGQPLEREEFWIDHPAHGRLGSGVGALVTLGPLDDVNGMLFSAYALHERHGVSRDMIPIAVDGGGDYMCFDYGQSATHPPVVYYSHEAPLAISFCHLADSFTSFLAMLEPPEDEPDEMD